MGGASLSEVGKSLGLSAPYSLKDISEAVEGKGKFAIRTLSNGVIPIEFRSWNWCTLEGTMAARDGNVSISGNGKGASWSVGILKSSTSLTVKNNTICSSYYGTAVTNIKVIFYTGTGY